MVSDRYSDDPYRASTASTPLGPAGLAVLEDPFVEQLATPNCWPVEVVRDEAGLRRVGFRHQGDPEYFLRQAREHQVEDLRPNLRTRTV